MSADLIFLIILLVASIGHAFYAFILAKKIEHVEFMLTSLISGILDKRAEPKTLEIVRKPGANRSSRTEEQRIMASQKRKEWWAKKKMENAERYGTGEHQSHSEEFNVQY